MHLAYALVTTLGLTPSRRTTANDKRALSLTMASHPEPATITTLYDVPVSNNGARARMILYYKNVPPDEVQVLSPENLGGLKSETFTKLNPHGLMPLLVTPEGVPIPESDTISRYLCARFAERGPRLVPAEPLAAAKMERICRLHDIYMVSIQQAMYKAVGPDVYPPFGKFATRRAALDELVKQLVTLEEYAAESDGPYLCGSEPTAADCAVFPTACFWMRMLPLFGFQGFMGPALSKWWEHMTSADDVGQKVYGEVDGALAGWEARGRWDAIRGAGLRDEAAPTIFDKILAREIPSDIVYEDDHVLAFRDIAPVAPTHVLVIPKVRDGLTQLQHASAEHKFILGHMLGVAVPAVVKSEGLDSYRLVVNDGADACQTVFHLHMHIIGGGKPLSWPPGVLQ